LGDRLILIGAEQQLLSIDATFGGDLRTLHGTRGMPRDVRVTNDGQLVVWTERALSGLDPRTLEPRWTKPLREYGTWAEIENSPWMLIRPKDSSWQLLDTHKGDIVQTDLPIAGGDTIVAAVREDDSIYVLTAAPFPGGPPNAR